MTNDLNTIPASVRDKLREINSIDGERYWMEIAATALPLSEKLCQPNIVIVDLDDNPIVKRLENFKQCCVDSGGITESIAVGDCIRIVKAALAALKEKP
jgi:hypothetical protein